MLKLGKHILEDKVIEADNDMDTGSDLNNLLALDQPLDVEHYILRQLSAFKHILSNRLPQINKSIAGDELVVIDPHENVLKLLINHQFNHELSDLFNQTMAAIGIFEHYSTESLVKLAQYCYDLLNINVLVIGVIDTSSLLLTQQIKHVSTLHHNKAFIFKTHHCKVNGDSEHIKRKSTAYSNQQAVTNHGFCYDNIALFLNQDYSLIDAVVLALAADKNNNKFSDDIENYPHIVGVEISSVFSAEQAINKLIVELNFVSNTELNSRAVPTMTDADDINSLKQQFLSRPFSKEDDNMGVYPVVDNLKLLTSLLEAGAKTVQLRIKKQSDTCVEQGIFEEDIEQTVKSAVALGKQFAARVYINDHWQLAVKYSAYGIHLGQEDCYTANLLAIRNAGIRLGISCHSMLELLLAKQIAPSYIALGHIFATTTKSMPSKPQGLDKLRHYVRLIHNSLPTVAIGGIDKTKLMSVKQTGVANIAVVSAITQAPCSQIAYQQLEQAWQQRQGAMNAI